MKKLLILGAGIEQLPGIITAKALGLYVIVMDQNPNAPGMTYADEAHVISTVNVDLAVEAAQVIRPDGVITLASDWPVRTAAAIGASLSLNTVSRETAIRATDKEEMRRALADHQVPVPEYFCVDDRRSFMEAADWFDRKGLRYMIKPADNAASRGVRLCSADTDREEDFSYSSAYSRSGRNMVEEYMEGPEVSVETMALNGTIHVVAITDKLTTGAPYFTEIGHSQPSRLDQQTLQKISEVAVSANKALGIRQGPSHTEIIVTKDGPKIVELGARLGGDNICTHLVPFSTGVSMVEGAIRCALGEVPDIIPKFSKGAAVRFLTAPAGTLSAIRGVDAARSVEGVRAVDLYIRPGEQVLPLRSSDQRLGCVVTRAGDANEAVRLCEQAASMIIFEIG